MGTQSAYCIESRLNREIATSRRALLTSKSANMQAQIKAVVSDELRARFARAKSVLALTGAGVSAESGVPTFRGGGNTAVWKGMPFDVISSAGMVQRDLPAGLEWFD